MTLKLGQPIDVHLATRYYQFNRSHAIRDVFDALVELITNADDSYHRLFEKKQRAEDGGPILIEYLASREQPLIVIHDKAEGMSLDEMRERLADVGTRRSAAGDRGFMARGAKDCTELGAMTFESIKDERFYKCTLTTKPQFVPDENRKVTKELRESLHIPRGNGTVVTLRIDPSRTLPRFDNLLRNLPWHYALRDLLADHSATRVLMKNLNRTDADPERLVYRDPVGEVVVNESFEITGFGSKARVIIQRAAEPFEDTESRFRRSGLLVKGTRAIHECSLLYPEFERDALAKKYFGRIECSDIDRLLREYDDTRERNEAHPAENPSLLIDPNRQQGLNRDHPFTKALFLVPSEKLRALIAAEREADRNRRRAIANQDTQNRLDRLAKRASEFLRQQLEDLDELGAGEDVDKSAFKHGTLIYPTYLNIGVDEERTLTFYAKASLVDRSKPEHIATVTVDDPAITALETQFDVRPHRSRDDRFTGTFRVRGEAIKDSIIIRVALDDLPEAQAMAAVVPAKVDERIFESPLEFEHRDYRVREGSRKNLNLYARYPDVVAAPTDVTVVSTDPAGVPVRGSCRLDPVAGSNYAWGTVTVQGRKLHAKAEIHAAVNQREATARIKVVQKPPETGVPIKFEIRDEDYGNFRARWADHEGKPNLLLVSARHKSLSRYLGPEPAFEGQNSPVFRILLAEIISDSVCRRSLVLESRERTWEFRWADLKEDHLIADDVFAKLQQRMRDFTADAHSIMLSDVELGVSER
jgi:hypothetical protein